MTILHKILICMWCSLLSLVFIHMGYTAEYPADSSMLPKGLIIEDVYQPGFGTNVGKTELVQGKAVIIHEDKARGYWAQKGLLLYKGDTIITEEKGRVQISLNDQSIITLASRTKLILTRSVYNPTQKNRSTFLGMDIGKARFLVEKLASFQQSEFKVKTKTAVAGVRGSDFIIEATDTTTQVTTGADTILDIISLAYLEKPPVTLNFYERTTVQEGELPTEVIAVSPEEVEDMIKKDFIPGTDEETEADQVEKGKEKAAEGVAGQDTADRVPAEKAVDEETPILFSANDVENPDLGETAPSDVFELPGIDEFTEITDHVSNVVDNVEENVKETKTEDEFIKEDIITYDPLPDFPGIPK